MAMLLLCLPGCQLTSDAWHDGGRDTISLELAWRDDQASAVAVLGRDGSVAFPVRVVWNPALAPSREFRRYYVFTPADLRRTSQNQECVKKRGEREPALQLWLYAAKFRNPAGPEPGHMVPSGTESRDCSEGDLPEALQRGTELLRNPRYGEAEEPRMVRWSDGQPAILEIDGRRFCLDLGGWPDHNFQTPTGQVWQVFLVPLAVVADVLCTPIYVTYFFLGTK